MKNNLFLIIIITLLVSVSAGVFTAVFINNQSLTPYNYLGFGQELNLNDFNYLSPSFIIQEPKKVIVNQDVKIDETIISLRSSILGVFPAGSTTSSAYYLPQPFAQALVATTDGWVMATWPKEVKDLKAAQLIKDYVLIDSNKKIYTIEQALIAPDEAGWFVFFKLSDATALNIRRIVSDDEIKVGQSVLFIDSYNSAGLNIIRSKKVSAEISSSDSYPYDLEFSSEKIDGPEFVFNLSGDIIGILDAQNKWLAASDIESYWRSILKNKKLEKPYLGVNYQDLTQILASNQLDKGALLKTASSSAAVVLDSPAALAGLKAGDIITKINGQELNEEKNLSLITSSYNIGDQIILNFIRQGEEKQVNITLSASE